jgi:PilZ domain
MALLGLVFRYRTLLGKCELAVGLSLEEIDEMCNLEAIFASQERQDALHRRRFRRSPVAMAALLRGARYNDHVKITQLSAGGFECRGAPYVEEGSQLEVVVDVEEHSYRFSARAVWLRDDGADYRIAFAFEGIPVLVQGVQPGLRKPSESGNKLMATIYQQLSAAA